MALWHNLFWAGLILILRQEFEHSNKRDIFVLRYSRYQMSGPCSVVEIFFEDFRLLGL